MKTVIHLEAHPETDETTATIEGSAFEIYALFVVLFIKSPEIKKIVQHAIQTSGDQLAQELLSMAGIREMNIKDSIKVD